MKSKILYSIIFFVLLMAACAPVAEPQQPAPIPTEPAPIVSTAIVQSIEVQVAQNSSLQVNAIVRGQLPDSGCTSITSVEQLRDGNVFRLTLTTTTDPLARCATALTPFEHTVALDVNGLPPARYVVNANGIESSFDLLTRDEFLFKQQLVEALNKHDFELLRLMMDESLMIGFWLSEGMAYQEASAIEQLRTNFLNNNASITADPAKNLIELLGGTDPISILGPEGNQVQASALYVSGWGLEGKDEAILFVGIRPDGSLYWQGVLVARDGFAEPIPVTGPNPPTPLPRNNQPDVKEEVIPTFSIVEVYEDDIVTIKTKNFPADTKFFVRMGKMGTKGIDGILVDTINSRNGGSFTVTFEIPEKLYGQEQIAIRLESNNGYYSYNWFDNVNSGTTPGQSDSRPTNVKYVMPLDTIVIRTGPGSQSRAIGSLSYGQIVKVTGISLDGNWWRIVCPDDKSGICWISASPKNTKPSDGPESEVVQATNVKYVMALQDLTMHSGPGKNHTVVGGFANGQVVQVTGISATGKWWKVICPNNVGSCWVSSDPNLTRPTDPTGMADVQSVEIRILESDPVQVNAIARGQLPDSGCTTISGASQVRNGNTFTVTVTTRTDPAVLCALMVTPFEHVISLDVSSLLPAKYIVNVNGVEESFELPGAGN